MADKDQPPMPPNVNVADIPIIGQVESPLGWWPVILRRCHCTMESGGLTIIVLNGLHQPSQCPKCKKMFVAEGFQAGPNGLSPVVSVALEQQAGKA